MWLLPNEHLHTTCRAFLAQPGPSTGPLQCFIVRSRGAARLYPRYSLYLDVGHKFLMAARKRKKSKASNYVMSLDEKVHKAVFCCPILFELHQAPFCHSLQILLRERHTTGLQSCICNVCQGCGRASCWVGPVKQLW